VCVCVYVCGCVQNVCVSERIYLYKYVCLYVHTFILVCVCVSVRVYARARVCMYI